MLHTIYIELFYSKPLLYIYVFPIYIYMPHRTQIDGRNNTIDYSNINMGARQCNYRPGRSYRSWTHRHCHKQPEHIRSASCSSTQSEYSARIFHQPRMCSWRTYNTSLHPPRPLLHQSESMYRRYPSIYSPPAWTRPPEKNAPPCSLVSSALPTIWRSFPGWSPM